MGGARVTLVIRCYVKSGGPFKQSGPRFMPRSRGAKHTDACLRVRSYHGFMAMETDFPVRNFAVKYGLITLCCGAITRLRELVAGPPPNVLGGIK